MLVSILATGPNFNTNFAALGLPVPVFGRGDAATLHVPGSDALGIVVDSGAAVTRVKVGQAVILDSWTGRNIRGYETHDGFNAQFVIVEEDRAIPLPEPLRRHTPERLAAMLLTYGTAYRAVVERLRAAPGDAILVMGGGKGTSFAGAQIAKALGARVLLMGSNPVLAKSLIDRGMADAFVDRREIPAEVFGPIPPGEDYESWRSRTEPFRNAVFGANGGRPVDGVFEHTGGGNFPLLVSALSGRGTLTFFGATGAGLRGEYKETFFHRGRRFVADARWVWMRQKQILFRKGSPESIFAEIGLLPGRRGLVWGADAYARRFARAALARGAEVAVIASRSREKGGIAGMRRMGIPQGHVLDRDAFAFPEDMPDPLTSDGRPNPEYASGFMKQAQALGKALWGIFGPRVGPDFVVERPDQSTLHFSTFVLRDYDEGDAMPSGVVVIRGESDLSIRGSHMYCSSQAAEVVRLLASGKIVMEQEDLDVTPLPGLPGLQQRMLSGSMRKPKGVALVQADREGRPIADYENLFLGESLRDADPKRNRFVDLRLLGETAVLTLTRPDALNALSEELLSQLSSVVREIRDLGTVEGRPVRALVLTGAGRAFVAGADVKEFLGKPGDSIARLAGGNIALFSELSKLPVPVIAVIDGFALGGGNELAMSAHYRIVTENASLGQPEVKLGIIPGYGGMQRLPRLVGPVMAAEMCVNGEPIDGHTAVSIGLADEFSPSATALLRAVRLGGEILSGKRTIPRKDWDAIGSGQKGALPALLERQEVREILAAPAPDETGAKDLRAARKAAGKAALLAMLYGYEHGFEAGLANDARAFGEATASPAGQEWVRRFVEKDPLQSSFLMLLPPRESPAGHMAGPITKKAPGDRQLSFEEIGRIAALITEKSAEGKVSSLPAAALEEALAVLLERKPPAFLTTLAPDAAREMGERIDHMLRSGEIGISVVDLGDRTGFPRENARPTYEVLLIRKKDELLWLGKKRLLEGGDASPCIFVTKAFLAKSRSRPHLLLQAILHPLVEWVFGMPHMVAVLCESAYNASLAGDGSAEVSDLNRLIAEEAGKERDFAYFDRILGASYEPDEYRMEELHAQFGADEGRIGLVVAAARAMGANFRKEVEAVLSATREEIAREQAALGRKALDEGDADRALQILRKLQLAPDSPEAIREEVSGLIGLAIRSYALSADPAYEGLRMEKGAIHVEPWAGRKAHEFARLLNAAADVVRKQRETLAREKEDNGGTDPLAETGAPRCIHVVTDLERPSAKFIDGHDRVHWEFEKSFVEALLSGGGSGIAPEGIPAILACRFVRDGAFPDEKLKIDRQFAVAAKGALEGYRFFQALPREVRDQIAAYYESSGAADPLYRLFLSLGEETHPAPASHLIRRAVSRTHSYNYVRYPDTALAGQVVVITGGGTGMGRALALEAAQRGANVVITGRRPAPLEETRADMDDLIRLLGLTNQTLIVQGNVGDPKYVGEMFERIERELGRIDILYNNAGVSGPVEFGSVYREDHFDQYKEAVNIHLTGAWLASLEAARIMESQPRGGVIVMVGTFYSESIHRHVLHAYPGRLPYTAAQSAKLALGDYLAWMLAEKNITVLSLNPSAVATERIQKGAGVFDKGSMARARIGRRVSPDALERDTLDRTVGREFVSPRDFARVALESQKLAFRRTVGGQRIPMGGVTYEQPPGVLPSPAALTRYPDMVGKVALVAVNSLMGNDAPLLEVSAKALARSGASVILSGSRAEELERLALHINAEGGEGMATVCPANLSNPSEVQGLFDGLPRVDLLLLLTGSVDWKRPLTHLPFEEWSAWVDRFGYATRLLCWQAERRMDRDRIDGTVVIVGPDLSGVPSIRERNLVQIFQAMLRPAVATEAMERALMRKAHSEGSAPAHVSDVNIGLVLPGRTDGRNKTAGAEKTAATVLWLVEEGKKVSGVVLLPDEQNSLARLPEEVREVSGSMGGKVVAVTGGMRNLGKEISLRFASEKATVVVASRQPRTTGVSPEEAEKARAELAAADAVLAKMRGCGARSLWIDADISRPQRVRALIEETRNRFGRIDAFVNNAGAGGDFSLFGDVLREHRQSWDAVLRSNFLGPWIAISHLREIMRGQPGGGTIVNVSTHYADQPYLFRTIYTVSKILIKGLTLALKDRLARDNIHIADVAPSLIAGPRMDWVMRNYANKFADQFGALRELRSAERKSMQELFVRCYDRSLPVPERGAASKAFLAAMQGCSLPKSGRGELEAWYGRIREWFACTVPDDPPTNEQVADAVLFAVKNARFLEDRFLGVSTLPSFSSFPGGPHPKKESVSGQPVAFLSVGATDWNGGGIAEVLLRAGAAVTSLTEQPSRPGRVEISRPASAGAGAPGRKAPEKIVRDLDLSDPRLLEPWLDNSLLGGPPPAGAVLCVGTSTSGSKPALEFSPEEMEGFLVHLGKVLNAFAEATRAVREHGSVVLIVPTPDSEEGHLVRAAAKQMVRTRLAEQHFLPAAKKVRVSLLTAPGVQEERAFHRQVVDILSGQSPPAVEPIPVGRVRP
ncbi:MAG: SDR family NAD(P)-dependent oxidoreductase [Deltaproteobacteria bacterium]|nr:SDR family NAD(P)-dependent oxidoreductase [Deltaproteobacteria bacterium]